MAKNESEEVVSGATITLKKGTTTITPSLGQIYQLEAGSYTYSISKEGYVTQADVALTVSESATETVTLVAETPADDNNDDT